MENDLHCIHYWAACDIYFTYLTTYSTELSVASNDH